MAAAGRVLRADHQPPATAGGLSTWRGGTRSNRVPWTFASFVITDRARENRAADGAPQTGERTPWVDVSSRDTTHFGPASNWARSTERRRWRVTLLVEVASAPERVGDPADDGGLCGGGRG